MVLCHNDRCCDEGVERRQRVFAFLLTLGFNGKSVYSDIHTWASYAIAHNVTMSAKERIKNKEYEQETRF